MKRTRARAKNTEMVMMTSFAFNQLRRMVVRLARALEAQINDGWQVGHGDNPGAEDKDVKAARRMLARLRAKS